jgi:hypothetical protein
MKPHPYIAFSRAIAVICMLSVASGCNMAAQKQEGEGDSQYASQSQALSGSGGGSLEGTRLEYDHHFGFKYEGSNNIEVDIFIEGVIPLTDTVGAKRVYECTSGGSYDWLVRQVTGSGTVNFDGTANITSGKKNCTCTLADKIKVSIQGVTFPEWRGAGAKCQIEMIALKVTETWFTNPNWQCVCNTPHEVELMHIQESLAMLPQISNPDLEKMTMIFPLGCGGESALRQQLVMSIIGDGQYEWTFYGGGNEGVGRTWYGPGYAEWQGPADNPNPLNCPPGDWGPPLESIIADNPVPKWEPLQ